MYTIILVFHIILAVFLVGLVLLQRPEGGALGILGSGTGSNFMTGRSIGNILTKMTAVVAGLFVVTSLTLAILAKQEVKQDSVLSVIPIQNSLPSEQNPANEQLPVTETTPAAIPTDDPIPAAIPGNGAQ